MPQTMTAESSSPLVKFGFLGSFFQITSPAYKSIYLSGALQDGNEIAGSPQLTIAHLTTV